MAFLASEGREGAGAMENLPEPPLAERRWLLVAALGTAWLASVLAIGLTRSGWLDEFFMVQATDPKVSWLTHLHGVWRSEPHPPLYAMMLWLWRHVVSVDHDIFRLRAFGVLLSMPLTVGALLYWRWARRSGLVVFALLLFTAPAFLFYPQEARSYFLSAFGGLYLSLYLLRVFEGSRPTEPALPDLAACAIAAFLLGTHAISLVYACLMFGLAGLVMLFTKRWRWFWASLGVSAAVLVPIIIFVAFTVFGALSTSLGRFWLTRFELMRTVVLLPVLTGGPVLCALLLALARRRELTRENERAAMAVAIAAIAAVVAFCAISLLRPIVTAKYLAAPIAGLTAPAAVLGNALLSLCPRWATPRPMRFAFVAFCSLALGLAAADTVRIRSDWRTPAAALNAVPSCNGALIPYLILNQDPQSLALNPSGWGFYFAWYAPHHRYEPALPQTLREAAAQACPVRAWIGQLYPRHLPAGYRAALTEICANGQRVGLAYLDGYLVVDASAQDVIRAWRGAVVPCAQMRVESSSLF
jgi:hypothetical protein